MQHWCGNEKAVQQTCYDFSLRILKKYRANLKIDRLRENYEDVHPSDLTPTMDHTMYLTV